MYFTYNTLHKPLFILLAAGLRLKCSVLSQIVLEYEYIKREGISSLKRALSDDET